MRNEADQFERNLEAKHVRRLKAELKTDERLQRLERKAEVLVGELCREGVTIHYIWPAGGSYREGSRADLIAFLVRNKYVR